MTSKHAVSSREIVADIRAGLTAHSLMDKYQVSLEKLQNIFLQLLDAHAIERSRLEPLLSIPRTRLDVGRRRELFRNYAFIKLSIFDMENLLNEGTIVDLSTKGFQTMGIPANVGDTKEFVVEPGYLLDVVPFNMEAICRWVSTGDEGKCVAGFEITRISAKGLLELRKITSTLTITK